MRQSASAVDERWEHSGLRCAVLDNGIGYLCGYVALPGSHPAHGLDCDDDLLADIRVHGGLTFDSSEFPGADMDGWVLGFDCAHFMDAPNPEWVASKSHRRLVERDDERYANATNWTVRMVREEVEQLAHQLAALDREVAA